MSYSLIGGEKELDKDEPWKHNLSANQTWNRHGESGNAETEQDKHPQIETRDGDLEQRNDKSN